MITFPKQKTVETNRTFRAWKTYHGMYLHFTGSYDYFKYFGNATWGTIASMEKYFAKYEHQTGFSWQRGFFASLGINLGLINVIIAHTVFCIPFAYMPIKAALEAMDPNLELAGRDLYSNKTSAFRTITLPLLTPGILSGFMLAFVISIDDFIITLMVAGGGATTLPVYIYSMVKMGVSPEVNAVSSLMLAFSILIVTFYWLFNKKIKY